MNIDELMHWGTPHVGMQSHSGRYEYGSGEEPYQHPYQARLNFLQKNAALMKEGKSEKERAEAFGLSINDYRKKRSLAQAEEKAALVKRARKLKDHDNLSYEKIGQLLGGYGESTVRGWLKSSDESRKTKIDNVADVLEAKLKNGEMIDIGMGSNLYLGVTKTTFDTAVKALQDKGYAVGTIDIEQPNVAKKYTTIKYIAPEGTTKADAWKNRDNINTIEGEDYSPNKGLQFQELMPPSSISSDRVYVKYRDEGGIEKDGLIGIRPGVDDVSLGNSHYAQVRIGVDGKYYAKGMAVYDDSIPEGYDICIYSNKRTKFSDKANGIEGALKEMKADPNNPFGANIKGSKRDDEGKLVPGGQSYYKDANGKYVKNGDIYELATKNSTGERYSLSAVNKLKNDDDWESYGKRLPAQFLSKQSLQLIQTQLDVTYKNKAAEYDEIMQLTNPIVKQKMLNDFAEGVDKTARHLDAAALPRQTTKVIIPVPELSDDEIYAPTYKNGEKLALVRYPHTGTFEIPVVTVNNNHPVAKKLLGNAVDAVAINHNVASQLSGADFDGDTVVTIPMSNRVKINYRSALDGLKDFDPSETYAAYPGMKTISAKQKQKEMGIVTNLITDMSVQNATDEEMVRAVKHSMVIIDAEKHNLNWKLSYEQNAIEALKQKYQKNPNKAKGYGGTTTLLSKLGNAKIKVDEVINAKVDENGNPIMKDGKPVKSYTADPNTGEYNYVKTGRSYEKPVYDTKTVINPETGEKTKEKVQRLDENGNPVTKTIKYKTDISPLDLVKDANELVSVYQSPQEKAYANYINRMRSLANKARKEALAVDTPKRDPQAAKNYAEEVDSLNAKLNVALKNKPLERQAQIKASVRIDKLKETDPELFESDKKDKLKKTKAKILTESRQQVGSGKQSVKITDKEWEAIQAHAISGTTLRKILENSDMDTVRKLATPRKGYTMSDARIARMKALSSSGLTIAEIAEACDCSTSTVSKYINS